MFIYQLWFIVLYKSCTGFQEIFYCKKNILFFSNIKYYWFSVFIYIESPNGGRFNYVYKFDNEQTEICIFVKMVTEINFWDNITSVTGGIVPMLRSLVCDENLTAIRSNSLYNQRNNVEMLNIQCQGHNVSGY